VAELPGAVLFACNFNRVRSPMAEALMKLAYCYKVFVYSVVLKHEEGQDEVDPFAAAVIDELGGDLSGFHPKTFAELEDESFDVVISLTPEAQHRAVEIAREHAVDIEYWPTHDPTLVTGSREQILDAYREVRYELARRIEERFGRPSTFGG
jgi:protein-tyrosine-phosphatase